jgi:precorrin-2 dehydrogenase/sirohydrochlorin ferrochelatase
MLPIVFVPEQIAIGLAGAGEGFKRRLALLHAAGIAEPRVFASEIPSKGELEGLQMLFIAGLAEDISRQLAGSARAAGVLVNVEDVPSLCDFHVPAQVRRGDLLFTISTAGRSPGLARILRERLGASFGPEWDDRLDELAGARAAWRAQGLSPEDVAARTRAHLDARGWLI